MRTLLKLYPRRIRNRYGDELLDLEDELRAQSEVSRTRLIRDMLTGALLIRPTRQRARLVIGAVLVIVGLAMAGTIIGLRGTDSPARGFPPHGRLAAQSVTAIPYGSCFVATSPSCSLAPCTVFTGQTSAEDAVAHSSAPATPRRPRLTGTRCAAYPHAPPEHPVFVARAVKPTPPRR
jgi:hypothetical protein